ncbi:MarR family transcriptional regulator [Amycolatopsis rhabdoformis]|uniref:MarR family transcriptional regulator n=1 Tax=Amycolatopsis rhabdoformis TaxID=1448059 RepID=A0ABZ1IPC9_9PSEU|nr:MarR family transcriptional regulator [Amycolatopsis rhabdoformis]WSE35140.1 MarR family transcriptional regulator [Amycolatopsis rhabdoformis]
MPDRISKDLVEAAADLRVALGRLVRRMRQGYVAGEATLSESSVLSRLDREGPATPGCLAELERVKPQAMGATLAGLVERGLVSRSPDAADGRRVLMSATPAGRKLLTDRRSLSTQRVAQALADGFDAEERRRLLEVIPLLERLADEL